MRPRPKTVLVNVIVSIRYHALAVKNTRSQLQDYVFDVIRPKLNLNDAFKQKNDIAQTVEALKRQCQHMGSRLFER